MLRNPRPRRRAAPPIPCPAMPATLDRHCADDTATTLLGAELARALRALGLPPLRVALHGELGAGKTTFVRGVLRELGVQGRIKSPSYALVEPYTIPKQGLEFMHSLQIKAYHVDLYRFSTPDEWLDAGLGDVLDGSALCFVEWPERAHGLPPADLDIRFEVRDDARDVAMQAGSPAGAAVIETMARAGSRAG